MTRDDELAAIASEIDALAERLADRSMDLLRQAIAGEEKGAEARAERVVTRARRSLEKAAGLLRGVDLGA